VGYFFTSGFYAIYQALETTEKIRILIGISTDQRVNYLVTEANKEQQMGISLFTC